MTAWVGDGTCDDTLNNEDCSYDGGDCCLSNIGDQFCIDCICFEINSTTTQNTTIAIGTNRLLLLYLDTKIDNLN
jgi:hypothetical protein